MAVLAAATAVVPRGGAGGVRRSTEAGDTSVPVPVVLCIDVEPDPRLIDPTDPPPWAGYEAVQPYVDDLRERVARRTDAPARFAWFLRMDPQVAQTYGSTTYVADRYGAHLESALALGDDVGLHPHVYSWSPEDRTWINDFGNPDVVEECLEVSVAAFRDAFGRPCRALRFGDRWLDTAAVALAERLGIQVDLTVEPGLPSLPTPQRGEQATGPLPDYRTVPRRPYWPSPTDFRLEQPAADRTIRMVPLTSAPLRRGPGPRLPRRRREAPLAMWHRWSPPNAFDQLLDRALTRARRPYLAFAIRTDFPVMPRARANVDAALDALLGHPSAHRFRFTTPAEALRLLDG